MKILNPIILVPVLVLCGCAKEDVGYTDSAGEKMVNISLPAGELGGFSCPSSTKTVLMDDLSVEWHNGDEILLMEDDDAYKLTNVNPDGPEALFVGEVPASWLQRNSVRTVLYPYNATLHNTGKGIEDRDDTGMSRVVVPPVQPLLSGTFARDYNYSVAGFKNTEAELQFINYGSLLRVTLTGNVTVESIEIEAGEYLTGTSFYTVSFMTYGTQRKYYFKTHGYHSEAYLADNPAPSATVTLQSEDGVQLGVEPQNFYAFVMPISGLGISYAGEYAVTVRTKEGKTFSEKVNMSTGFKVGEIFGLGEFDLICTFADFDGQSFRLDPTGQVSKEFRLVSDDLPVLAGLPDWLDYTVEGSTVLFRSGINTTDGERSADVTISQGNMSGTITFIQEPAVVMNASSFGCDAGENVSGTFVLEDFFVNAFPDWNVTGNDWITPVKDSNSFTIKVSENTTGQNRTGLVSLVDGEGILLSTLSVTQTWFGYDSLMGDYTLLFTDKNKKDGEWTISLSAHPESESSYSASVISKDGTDISYYCPDIRFDYVANGTEGPKLEFTGPQYFEGQKIYLMAISTETGEAAEGYDVGYDLFYSESGGKPRFDFTPNAMARLKYPLGLSGFGIYKNGGSVWEFKPRKGTDCLSMTGL